MRQLFQITLLLTFIILIAYAIFTAEVQETDCGTAKLKAETARYEFYELENGYQCYQKDGSYYFALDKKDIKWDNAIKLEFVPVENMFDPEYYASKDIDLFD